MSCAGACVTNRVRRYLLSLELTNTLDSAFCILALKQSLIRVQLEILSADQAAKFTSQAFTEGLHGSQIAISMDGRGASAGQRVPGASSANHREQRPSLA
jgi:putative transposase